ncbi:MAG: DNA oxidative demethylase AlkB [Stellaceae bacterium]
MCATSTRSPAARAEVAIGDLFGDVAPAREAIEQLAEGAVLLRGFARNEAAALVAAVAQVSAAAPFRHMVTPGGWKMSVAMTSCGKAGWVTDRSGYSYAAEDPLTGLAWPPMPAGMRQLAARAAAASGFGDFGPDACLINRYEPGARLSLHRDEDERDLTAPVVSVSFGLSAVFLWGGLARNERAQRVRLENGDVVVWGGPSRLVYHGVAPLGEGVHPLTARSRINLTFRKAL